MTKSKHINTRLVTDGVEVIADDYEVFDYLDDFLTNMGFNFAFFGEEERDGHRWYLMHFDGEATRILEALESVSSAEIDRIWALNNSARI